MLLSCNKAVLAYYCIDLCICTSLHVNDTPQVGGGLYLFEAAVSCILPHDFRLLCMNIQSYL